MKLSFKLKQLASAFVIAAGVTGFAFTANAQDISWKNETFSATYADSDVRTAIRHVLKQNGMQVIFRPSVEGSVDGSFNMPLQGAFNKLIEENALSFEYDQATNMVTVFKGANIASQDFVPLKNPSVSGRVMAAARDLNLARNIKINSSTGIATLKGDASQVSLLRKLINELDEAETDRRKYEVQRSQAQAQLAAANAQARKAANEAARYIDPASLEFKVIPLRYATVGETTRIFQGQTVTVPGIEKTLLALMGVDTTKKNEDGTSTTTSYGSGLPGGLYQIVPDERTNSVIVRGTPERVAEMESLIERLDRSVPMIEVEVMIVRAQDEVKETLGIEWAHEQNTGSNVAGITSGATIDPGDVTTGLDGGSSIVDTAAAAVIGDTISFAGGYVWQGAQSALQVRLNALESDGKLTQISSPTLVTLNNVTSNLENEATNFFQTTVSGDDGSTLVPLDAGLKLSITPSVILAENSSQSDLVRMQVEAKNTALASSTIGGSAAVSGQSVQTEVIVPAGRTFVVAGLVDDDVTDSVTGVPLLKDLPFLGQLFRTDTLTDTFDETLFFITPKVVIPEEIMPRDIAEREYIKKRKRYMHEQKQDVFAKSKLGSDRVSLLEEDE